MSGDPEGVVRFIEGQLLAGPDGATLAVGGAGLLAYAPSSFGFEMGSAGGAFLNTGLLRVPENALQLRNVVLENAGTIRSENQAVITPFEGAVLRNRAGATVELLDGARILAGDGTGQFENAGLLHARRETFTTTRTSSLGGRLRSQPGSEVRIGDLIFLDLEPLASTSLPAGVRVTGDGTLRISSTSVLIEGEVSPGTEAQPLATLTSSGRLYFSPTAGDPRLTIDVDAGGVSDRVFSTGPNGPEPFPVRPAGTLVVRVRPGYTPQVGDTFTILQSPAANLIQGEFAQIVAQGAPADIAFVAEYSNVAPSTITVRAVVDVAGENTPDGTPARVDAHGTLPEPVARRRDGALGVPSAARVEVRVFDLLGRQVAVLADGAEAEAGWTRRAGRLGCGAGRVRSPPSVRERRRDAPARSHPVASARPSRPVVGLPARDGAELGATALRYTLHEAGPTTVAIHDLLGRAVAVVAQGDASQASTRRA